MKRRNSIKGLLPPPLLMLDRCIGRQTYRGCSCDISQPKKNSDFLARGKDKRKKEEVEGGNDTWMKVNEKRERR